MSKPMTIRISTEAANTIRKAVQMTLTAIGMTGEGAIKVTEITETIVKFEYTEEKQFTGSMKMTIDGNHYIIENVEIAEVVEAPAAEVVTEVVEAPAAEVVAEAHTVTMSLEEKRAAWDIFVKEWAKGHAEAIHAISAAEATEARIVEDVDASYDDDAIDEALDAIRDAVIAGRQYAHLIETAQDLGATRHAISDVIRDAKDVA